MAAPVVVVLATVVNAAAPAAYAPESDPIAPVPASVVDLSWAVRGGAAQEAQTTRVLLARKAASDIRSLDRVHPQMIQALLAPEVAAGTPEASGSESRGSGEARHVRSSHQHSAP